MVRKRRKRKPYKAREVNKNSSIYICILPGTCFLLHWRGYRNYTKARRACPHDGVVSTLKWAKKLRTFTADDPRERGKFIYSPDGHFRSDTEGGDFSIVPLSEQFA
jgi:hypothetical protein